MSIEDLKRNNPSDADVHSMLESLTRRVSATEESNRILTVEVKELRADNASFATTMTEELAKFLVMLRILFGNYQVLEGIALGVSS